MKFLSLLATGIVNFFKNNWITVSIVSTLIGAIVYMWFDYQGLREQSGQYQEQIKTLNETNERLAGAVTEANNEHRKTKDLYDLLLADLVKADLERKKYQQQLAEAEKTINDYYEKLSGFEKQCYDMPINSAIINGLPIKARNPNQVRREDSN